MSRYFLDTEFNGFGGEVISIALVRDDGAWLSLVFGCKEPVEWVKEHVIPFLYAGKVSHEKLTIPKASAARLIKQFIGNDPNPIIIADWPDDIRYFCELIMTGPGTMISFFNLTFQMIRIPSYPTTLEGAVQHNAWWDAMALRHLLVN